VQRSHRFEKSLKVMFVYEIYLLENTAYNIQFFNCFSVFEKSERTILNRIDRKENEISFNKCNRYMVLFVKILFFEYGQL